MAILEYIKKSKNIIDFLNSFKKKTTFNIFKFIKEENIIFLDSKNKKEAIFELIDLISNSKKIDKDIVFKKIVDRENLISTGIGSGIAIPHAKIEEIDDFIIAIGIQKNKIDWNSIDHLPVTIVVLIIGPEFLQDEYLKLLSSITLLLKNLEFRRKIMKSQKTKEIFDLFNHF